jgi:hypothetical protein
MKMALAADAAATAATRAAAKSFIFVGLFLLNYDSNCWLANMALSFYAAKPLLPSWLLNTSSVTYAMLLISRFCNNNADTLKNAMLLRLRGLLLSLFLLSQILLLLQHQNLGVANLKADTHLNKSISKTGRVLTSRMTHYVKLEHIMNCRTSGSIWLRVSRATHPTKNVTSIGLTINGTHTISPLTNISLVTMALAAPAATSHFQQTNSDI